MDPSSSSQQDACCAVALRENSKQSRFESTTVGALLGHSSKYSPFALQKAHRCPSHADYRSSTPCSAATPQGESPSDDRFASNTLQSANCRVRRFRTEQTVGRLPRSVADSINTLTPPPGPCLRMHLNERSNFCGAATAVNLATNVCARGLLKEKKGGNSEEGEEINISSTRSVCEAPFGITSSSSSSSITPETRRCACRCPQNTSDSLHTIRKHTHGRALSTKTRRS